MYHFLKIYAKLTTTLDQRKIKRTQINKIRNKRGDTIINRHRKDPNVFRNVKDMINFLKYINPNGWHKNVVD